MARILIIEDDIILRQLLTMSLTIEGFDVTEAENGAEALGILKEKSDFNLIVADLMMPVMDGLRFLRELDATMQSPPPCAILSASKLGSADAEVLTSRGVKIFRKPIELPDFIAEIRKLVAPARA